MKLFPYSQITELEILTLCRRELTSGIYPTTEMLYDSLITINSRHSFNVCHEMGVTILKLTSSRHHYNSLEIQRTFIPARTLFCQTVYWACRIIMTLSRHSTQSLLILKILHTCSSSLNDNKINSWTYFISFWIAYITCSIITDICFQIRIHSYFWNLT